VAPGTAERRGIERRPSAQLSANKTAAVGTYLGPPGPGASGSGSGIFLMCLRRQMRKSAGMTAAGRERSTPSPWSRRHRRLRPTTGNRTLRVQSLTAPGKSLAVVGGLRQAVARIRIWHPPTAGVWRLRSPGFAILDEEIT
jgi:hypothetical protein